MIEMNSMIKEKHKAISILQQYLLELISINNQFEGNSWKVKVRDTLVLYLGEESAITKRIDRLYFTVKISIPDPNSFFGHSRASHQYEPQNKVKFENLIKSAINYIELNGTKKPINFIHQFKPKEIIIFAFTVLNLVFWFGWFVGSSLKEREIIQIEQKLNKANLELQKRESIEK